MRLHLALLIFFAGAIAPAVASTHIHRGPTGQRLVHPHSSGSSRATTSRPQTTRGGIDSARATEIQTALVHQGYLSGTPSGTWDAETQAAMQKVQADNGWQTKLIPDSRAIIKLGLGPEAETRQAASPATGAAPSSTAPAPEN